MRVLARDEIVNYQGDRVRKNSSPKMLTTRKSGGQRRK